MTTRSGEELARLRRETDRILALFEAAGASRLDVAVLQPADLLLDLYGEDIRARAFTTRDTFGEMMLRPDFTVPVVQNHMAAGMEPARYAYSGPVWRRRAESSARPVEYLQTGFELFDRGDAAQADAEVFSLISRAVEGADLKVATGDIGLILAAIDGLETSPERRSALRRHVWRPARFQHLLNRFGAGHADWVAGKSDLISKFRAEEEAILKDWPSIGLRKDSQILARLNRLEKEAACPPLETEKIALLEALLNLSGKTGDALRKLQDLCGEMPALKPAVQRLQRRLDALNAKGIDAGSLPFEGSYGRTTMEYYDGFVFGFYAADRDDLPVVASGGRYDALTTALGQGAGIPAVGGIVRPEALLEAEVQK